MPARAFVDKSALFFRLFTRRFHVVFVFRKGAGGIRGVIVHFTDFFVQHLVELRLHFLLPFSHERTHFATVCGEDCSA